MSVAVYCRVSSEEQAERGTIEIQKEFAAKYVMMVLAEQYLLKHVQRVAVYFEMPEKKSLIQSFFTKSTVLAVKYV